MLMKEMKNLQIVSLLLKARFLGRVAVDFRENEVILRAHEN